MKFKKNYGFIVSTAFLIKIYKTIISKIPEGKL